MFAKLSPVTRTSAKLSVALWCGIVAFVAPGQIYSGQVANIHEGISLVWGPISGLAGAALLYIVFQAIQALPSVMRLVALVISVAAFGSLQTFADYSGYFVLDALFEDVTVPPTDIRSLLLTNLIYTGIYACNAAIFWITLAAKKARDQELELANSQTRFAWSEMERLRLQINPHFMCNSLNSVAGLITAGRYTDAEDMAIRLADFLRASVEERSAEVTVAEEYEILEAYLDVEAVRFGARLGVELICEGEASQALLPQFLLQPLVENAVAYAVSPAIRLVTVRVEARRQGEALLIEVTDDGDGAPERPIDARRGIGLTNIRARLATRYGDAASLETRQTDEGFRATIRLPLTLAAAVTPPSAGAKAFA